MYNKYYELNINLYLLKNLLMQDSYQEISKLINYSFNKSKYLSKLHKEKDFKHYSFSGLYPIEKDKIYKANEIYCIIIRSYKKEIIDELIKCFMNLKNDTFVVTNTNYKEWLTNKQVNYVDSLTPTIIMLKDKDKIWEARKRDLKLLEQSIFLNAISKYQMLNNDIINYKYEDIIDNISVKNNIAIIVNYKNIKLLGYKLRVKFKQNIKAQNIANLVTVEGLGAKNSTLGMGFVKPYFKRRDT